MFNLLVSHNRPNEASSKSPGMLLELVIDEMLTGVANSAVIIFHELLYAAVSSSCYLLLLLRP